MVPNSSGRKDEPPLIVIGTNPPSFDHRGPPSGWFGGIGISAGDRCRWDRCRCDRCRWDRCRWDRCRWLAIVEPSVVVPHYLSRSPFGEGQLEERFRRIRELRVGVRVVGRVDDVAVSESVEVLRCPPSQSAPIGAMDLVDRGVHRSPARTTAEDRSRQQWTTMSSGQNSRMRRPRVPPASRMR